LSRLSDTAPYVSGALVTGSSSRILARIVDSPHVANLVSKPAPGTARCAGCDGAGIRRTTAEFDRAEQRSFAYQKPPGDEVSGCSRGAGLGGCAGPTGYRALPQGCGMWS
jgi:hypothetical protein